MPPYRFSWDAFDDRTVAALADTSGHDPRLHTQTARAWLSARVKRPTPEFVWATKDVLVRTWLPTYVGTKHIVDRLIDAGIGPMRQPRSSAGYVNYVATPSRCGSMCSRPFSRSGIAITRSARR
jgi:hypothetical protein